MEKFNIKSINSTEVGKIEKTTGMVSLLVKEGLVYSGLLKPEVERSIHSSSSMERLEVYKDLNIKKSVIQQLKRVLDKLEALGQQYNVDMNNNINF